MATSAGATENSRVSLPEIARYCVTELGAASGLEYTHLTHTNQRDQALGWGYLGDAVEVFQWDRGRGYIFVEELAREKEMPA